MTDVIGSPISMPKEAGPFGTSGRQMSISEDQSELPFYTEYANYYDDIHEPDDDHEKAVDKAPPPPPPEEWKLIIEDIRRTFRDQKVTSAKILEADDLRVASKLNDNEKYAKALKWIAPNGTGFLHFLLRDRDAAECCPPNVIRAILRHDPTSIERAVDGNIHPLTRAILNSYYTRRSPFVLDMMAWLHAKDPNRQLKNENGEGRRCLEAAFQAMSHSKPMQQLIVLTLVRWATEPMLKGIVTKENLSPLHQAVVFDRGYAEPEKQPELVSLLLERYEDGIHDSVPPGTYKMSTGEVVVRDTITVYEWHKRTADHFVSIRSTSEQGSQSRGQRVFGSQERSQNQQNDKVSWQPTPANRPRSPATQSVPSEKSASVNGHAVTDANSANPTKNKQGATPQSHLGRLTTEQFNEKDEQPTDEDKAGAQTLAQAEGQQNKSATTGSQYDKERERKNKLESAKEASRRVKLKLQESYLQATILTPTGGDTGEVAEMDETEIKQFFGNEMQNVEIGLHLGEQPRGEPIREADVVQFFNNRTFNSVLAYVSLPQAPVSLNAPKSKFAPPRYHDERLFYFDWLHKKKSVNKILKIIVDDTQRPHRDDVIEEAIGGVDEEGYLNHFFDVKILKWRKIDLDPNTILRAAPNIRELHLEWSGSNVALRGWSALDGLPQLPQLRQVHLTYVQGNESTHRLTRNIEEFRGRLNKCREEQNEQLLALKHITPKANSQTPETSQDTAKRAGAKVGEVQKASTREIRPQETQTSSQTQAKARLPSTIKGFPEIEVIEHPMTESGAYVAPLSSPSRSSGPKHKWLKYMRDFVSFIPDLPSDMKDLNLSPMTFKKVTVALIDDGVDVFTSDMVPFSDHILAGVSFDRSNDRHSPREWSSRGGHGTLMAKLILAVCPHANIIPYRVLMHPDKDTGTSRPEPESAAKAIIDAVNRDVDIISMSWSITGDPKSMNDADKAGFQRLKNIMNEAVGLYKGTKPTPLLFCAAADDGIGSDKDKYELPSKMNWTELFRIGAATNALQTWVKVTKPSESDFFFPGVDIPDLRQNFQYAYDSLEADPYSNSGSSIACALAAGQAALVLHCVKLGIYYTKKTEKQNSTMREKITEDDLKYMKQFEYMREAFEIVCTENLSKHKVSYPAQRFERASDQMRKLDDSGRLVSPGRFGPIASLVRNLIGWRD